MSESLPVVPSGIASIELIDKRDGAFGVQGSGDTSGFGGLLDPRIMPGPSVRPFDGWFEEVSEELDLALTAAGVPVASAIEKVVIDRDEITFFVPRERILEVLQRFRDEPGLRFEMSLGVSGVHYPQETGRELHAVYHLLSITHNRRVRVEVTCPQGDAHIPSSVAIYPTHDWHERETWDFFGIEFDGHPALTRIQMPDDWPGHPQRKDYPLGGIPVEYKGATVPPPDLRRSYN